MGLANTLRLQDPVTTNLVTQFQRLRGFLTTASALRALLMSHPELQKFRDENAQHPQAPIQGTNGLPAADRDMAQKDVGASSCDYHVASRDAKAEVLPHEAAGTTNDVGDSASGGSPTK